MYFKKIGNMQYIYHENLKDCLTKLLNLPLHPGLSYIGNKTREKFDGGSLKQDKTTFTHGSMVNIYILYEISVSDSNNNYLTLEKLFVWCS